MDSKKSFATQSLTDDLVVKILSGVPFKSFCRFKCVCKAWLAFSSDPHYRQMLPKIPTGLLLGRVFSVQLVSLSPNDEEIDGALTFLPHYEYLTLVDSSNGLVLCKYKSIYTSPHICRFIVCNPATREWRILPDTHPDPYGPECKAILAFDPSWSARFYVLNYQKINKLEVFSSDLPMWIVDNYWSSTIEVDKAHIFIGEMLHVMKTGGRHIQVLGGLERMCSNRPPYSYTIELPDDRYSLVNGCFGQSLGFLQCAFPEEGGRRVAVWRLDTYSPCKWSLKHLLCVQHAFGNGYFDRIGDGDLFSGFRGYRIIALDLERDVFFLIDKEAIKLLSYNISNGKLSEIQYCSPSWKYYYYVACYSKLPG